MHLNQVFLLGLVTLTVDHRVFSWELDIKKEILIYAEISAVSLDLASTGKMMVSSRKRETWRKAVFNPTDLC